MNSTPSDPLAFVKAYKKRTQLALERISDSEVTRLIELLADARDQDRQIFIIGNGGSAATASHFATDLGKGASIGRERRFRVIALTDNVPWITAMANDTDYSQVFVEPLKNYARPGDVLVAFSGSGNSRNVLTAVEWANQNGMVTVGITGSPGGRLRQQAAFTICADSEHMGCIEDCHCFVQHIVGYYFMEGCEDRRESAQTSKKQ